MIICLGWGSLIWRPEDLPVVGGWNSDGPLLPVEFARESKDGRLTLVIAEGAPPVAVLWSRLSVDTIGQGISALAERENISDKNVGYSIGFWTPDQRSKHPDIDNIAAWAIERDIRGVVWTALKPRYKGTSKVMPTQENALDHLRSLDEEERTRAEEYIRRTPTQIATPYRQAIEEELGWTPL